MSSEGRPMYIHETHKTKQPIGVVDVHGHNAVIYATRNIWRDKGILTPELHLTFSFPDVQDRKNVQHLWDLVMTIRARLVEKLGAEVNIDLAQDGLLLKPKTVEHQERDAAEFDRLDTHPAFFESREMLSEKILQGITAIQSNISVLFNDAWRNTDHEQESEPRADGVAVEAAKKALQTIEWFEKPQKEVKEGGRTTYIDPEHWEGFLQVEPTGAFGVSQEKLDHGLRTVLADMLLDIGVIGHRTFQGGKQLWFLRATTESGERLVKAGLGRKFTL